MKFEGLVSRSKKHRSNFLARLVIRNGSTQAHEQEQVRKGDAKET